MMRDGKDWKMYGNNKEKFDRIIEKQEKMLG